MTCGVYVIRNTKNGKIYIGGSINIEKRWAQHRSNLNAGRHVNRYLQNVWNKDGADSFVMEVVEVVNPTLLIEREQHYLDTIDHDYNLSSRADRPAVVFTPEIRAKMSAAKRGRKFSDGIRLKISASLVGRSHSEERRKNISAGKMGKTKKITYRPPQEVKDKISKSLTGRVNGPPNDETRRKISESHKGLTHSDDTKKRISEAQKGKVISEEHRQKISKTLKGKRKPEGFGKNPSPETLAKRSEGLKRAWERRRAEKLNRSSPQNEPKS